MVVSEIVYEEYKYKHIDNNDRVTGISVVWYLVKSGIDFTLVFT